ncbi:MAG TPA: YdcF family protein [Xanthobacteraceae bacterium]|jgi:uncharacterized SAM-binding protein YcdF (DUF218 family)
MFFVLSKVLGFFTSPANVILVAGVCGVLLVRTRFARVGWSIASASLVLLAIFGFSPAGNALIIPLEERFPAWDGSKGAPDGIVALGGALNPEISAAHGDAALNESAERITAVVELARRYPATRIIFSGGDPSLAAVGGTEAQTAVALFERLGLGSGRVIAENRSRNTLENARFSKELAMPKPGERWLLVTSAYHMPRAMGVFRRVGFPVEAYPVDWRTRGPEDFASPFANLADGLSRTDTAVHEWVGLAVYWLTGRTSELFPGPP